MHAHVRNALESERTDPMACNGGDALTAAMTRPGHIAIVGLACRFPQADNAREFWENLTQARDCITRFAEGAREAPAGIEDRSSSAPRVLANGVLRDIDQFDAQLFGFSDNEAAITDPQQRLGLEVAWQCMVDAGIDPRASPSTVGVFTSSSSSTYLINELLPRPERNLSAGGVPLLVRNDKDHAASLIAYKLGCTGPALNVGCGCSGGLAAVHLGVHHLCTWQCDVALCGASSIIVPQLQGHHAIAGGIYSHDGYCRVFDQSASGTIGGSGVGFLALKRLDDAIRDGDRVYATIIGSAVNNDGNAKAGYTAPSVERQAAAVALALAVSGVSADTISMVEAHGTGTTLGDPIEVQALTRAFSRSTRARNFCALGSVKSNIGHADVAAGIAGIIKTALSLSHSVIPATLHCSQPSSALRLSESPFFINTRTRPWEPRGNVRRASVNSLGMGGTNVHVVLEEFSTPREARPWSSDGYLFPLSAHSPAALHRWEQELQAFLTTAHEVDAGTLAYTLAMRRPAMKVRRAVVASTLAELRSGLLRDGAGAESTERRTRFILVLGAGRSDDSALPDALLQLGLAEQLTTLEQTVQQAGWRNIPHFQLQAVACAAWLRKLGIPIDAVLGLEYAAAAARVAGGEIAASEALESLVHGPANEAGARLVPGGSVSIPQTARTHPKEFLAELRRAWSAENAEDGEWHVCDPFAVFESAAEIQRMANRSGIVRLIGSRSVGSRDFMSAVAAAWQRGASVDWRALYPASCQRWIELPEYPLQRERYWVATERSGSPSTLESLCQGARACFAEFMRPAHFAPFAGFPGLEQALDELCLHCVARFVGPVLNQTHTDAGAVAKQLGVHERHRRFFESLWQRSRQQPIDRRELRDVVSDLKARYPAFTALIDVLHRLGESLPANMRDATRGALEFHQILNDGSLQRALQTPIPFSNVEACCRAVVRLIEQLARREAGRRLRILEVGAGRMILTQYVEELIRSERVEYWITDASPSVVQEAAQQVRGRGLKAHTATVDITRPIAEQCQPIEPFDVVIALNVVHVCAHPDQALSRLREVLRPGGHLAILESIADPLWATFIWGWSEGWWNFADAERRDSPLMRTGFWQTALQRLQPTQMVTFDDQSGHGDTALWVARFDDAPPRLEPSKATPTSTASPDQWLYKPCFIRTTPPKGLVTAAHELSLVLADDESEIPAPLRSLFQEDSSVIRVFPGSAYEKVSPVSYRVHPTSSGDLRALLAEFRRSPSTTPTRILVTWRLRKEPADETRFFSLLALAQAISTEIPGKCTVAVVTHGLFAVTGAERLNPAESLVSAAAKIIPREYWNCTCRVIDLDDGEPDTQTWPLVKYLATAPEAPALAAIRSGSYWVPWYSPIAAATTSQMPSRLRKQGIYLIFGGLGGLGFGIARFLAQHYCARLVLAGRSADPAEPRVREQIEEIRQLGGDCIAFPADITELADVNAALAEAERTFGGLHGVIHSAGEIDDGGVIHGRNFEHTARKLAPKVRGARLLAQALDTRQIDFLVLFSSIGSALYRLKFGEVAYVAGNDFLVTFAHEWARRAPYFVQVIQWTDWDSAGMWSRARSALHGTYSSSAKSDLLAHDLLQPLTYEQGTATFSYALRTDEPHLIVSARPLEPLLQAHERYQPADYAQHLDQLGLARRVPEREPTIVSTPASAPAPAPRSAATDIGTLKGIWEEVIGCEVQPDSDFFVLGGDSLLALRVISRVRDEFQVSLPLEAFFSCSTLQEMCTYVDNLRWAGSAHRAQ